MVGAWPLLSPPFPVGQALRSGRNRSRARGSFDRASLPYGRCLTCGEVPEWSIGAVSKTVERASVPRVRIPPSPPPSRQSLCAPDTSSEAPAVLRRFQCEAGPQRTFGTARGRPISTRFSERSPTATLSRCNGNIPAIFGIPRPPMGAILEGKSDFLLRNDDFDMGISSFSTRSQSEMPGSFDNVGSVGDIGRAAMLPSDNVAPRQCRTRRANGSSLIPRNARLSSPHCIGAADNSFRRGFTMIPTLLIP